MDQAALPSPFALLQQTIDALMKNPTGYGLAGLGVLLVVLPLTVFAIVGIYAGMFVGMLPGLMMEDELVIVLGMMGTLFAAMFLLILGVVAITAPMYASILRAVDLDQQGIAPLGLGSSFNTASQDLGKVFGIYLLTMMLVMPAALFFYVPGLIVGFFLHWAVPGVVIDRLSPFASVSRSFAHVRENIAWHLQVYLITMGIFVLLSQIPLIGMVLAIPLGYDFQLRAYRVAFARS